MSKTDRPWNPDQDWLLPPSPREWLPEGDLVYFMLDAVQALDLSEIPRRYEQEDRGFPPFPPRRMVTLLWYAYGMGVYSSRRIQRLCERDAAYRVIVGGDAPNFRTISDFRKLHLKEVEGLLAQVLRLCAEAGVEEKIGALDADAGSYSEENVSHWESEKIDPHLATERLKHHEKAHCDPGDGPVPEGLPPQERMVRKLRTKHGRETYAQRKGRIEPILRDSGQVFGQIQQGRGFRQFLWRGLAKMRGEWRPICLTHNLLKWFGAPVQAAA